VKPFSDDERGLSFVERTPMTVLVSALFFLVGFVPPQPTPAFAKLDLPGLPNVVEVHAKVLSGGQPEGEQAFARLAALGVKTIVSVDGMKPDVESARKYGMRYVHLPHGYDGVPDDRAVELAKAVRELPGRIYIHCHHGRHRSPTAAAVACVGAGFIDQAVAENLLKTAGTSRHYLGLFESARRSRRFTATALDQLKVDYREIVPLPPLPKAMVEIDLLADRISQAERQTWKSAAADEKPPRHAVLLLREQYRELLRDPAVAAKPPDFKSLLTEGEAKLGELEARLSSSTSHNGPAPSDLWKNVQRNCAACHARFRDVPQQLQKP